MTGTNQAPAPHDFSGRNSGPSGGELAGIGMELVVLVVAGMFGGQWIDRRFHSAPWGLVACVFLGAVLGFAHMFVAVSRSVAKVDK